MNYTPRRGPIHRLTTRVNSSKFICPDSSSSNLSEVEFWVKARFNASSVLIFNRSSIYMKDKSILRY
jgi:hypothetical protein